MANLRLSGIADLCFMQEEPLSVSQLTQSIKSAVESGIGDVCVVGEISNFKHHTSGHRYFTLKDASSQISCTMWRSRTLSFRPEDGMRVVAQGKVTVYAAQGKYQLECAFMQPEGVGDLYVAFERLKAELAQQGYFDVSRKKALPTMPMRIGIVTSQTGAAIRDMLTTLERRFPVVSVVFRQTLVQGDGAAHDIASAIHELDAANVDLIIVGRGGGSIEDLWAFNTREVADAMYNCNTPVISAVGHETDVTIADFVADLRAATPTAAAELATPTVASDILYGIDITTDRIVARLRDTLHELTEMAESFADGRAMRRLQERIAMRLTRLEDMRTRFTRSMLVSIQKRESATEHLRSRCQTLHPMAPLARGYAVVEKNGLPLPMHEHLQPGDIVQVRRNSEISTVEVQSIDPLPESK